MTTGKLIGLALIGSASFISAVSAEPVADGGRKFTTSMSGAEECNTSVTPTVCGVGDPDGSATGSVTINVGQERVCWEFGAITNIAVPNRGHIHKAPAGTNGGIVRQDSYATLNAFAGWDITPNANVRVNANNITDEKYIGSLYQVGFYAAPANYSVTFGYKF